MKPFSIILLIFFYSFGYTQSLDYSKHKIILLGEYHYFTKNDSIQLTIINSIIENSPYKKIAIALEYPPELEYYIEKNDTNSIEQYFLYNIDSKYSPNKCSKLNKMKLDLVLNLLNLKKNNKSLQIKCVDTHYTIRSTYFFIEQIMDNYSIFPNSFKNQIEELLVQEVLTQKDLIIYDSTKYYFENNKTQIKSIVFELDYIYLEKIFQTPFFDFNTVYGNTREELMHNNLKQLYHHDKQIVYIVGNGHVRNTEKNNLYNKIKKEKRNIFGKNIFTIGIIPIETYLTLHNEQYDLVIINKFGGKLFSLK